MTFAAQRRAWSSPFSVHSGEFHRELCRQYGNCSITVGPPPPPSLRNVWLSNGNFYEYPVSQLTSYLILGRRLSGNANIAFFEIRRKISTSLSSIYLRKLDYVTNENNTHTCAWTTMSKIRRLKFTNLNRSILKI